MIHFLANAKLFICAAGRITLVTLALIGMGVGLATAATEDANTSKGKLKAVTTIGMITDIVRNIGGERVQVAGIMGEGIDPHLYKASPGDVRLMADADIIFYNGLHLEGKMADVLIRLARSKPVFAVTESIDPSKLREPPEFQGQYDPHVWFDVSLWSIAVERVRDALIEQDPEGRERYSKNAADYLRELSELHAWCRTELAKIPAERRVLVTAHDAFGYFGRAYEIEVAAIQGVSTDSEASLRDINGLVDLLVKRKIGAVFVESTVPSKTVESLVEGSRSRGHEVRVGGQLYSDAMGKDGTPDGTYIGMVRHNVNTIRDALLGSF